MGSVVTLSRGYRSDSPDPADQAVLRPTCYGYLSKAMTPRHRLLNLAGVLLPFAGFLVAVVLLWNTLVDWSDLAIMAFMYAVTCFGVTGGFHRLLTHRSFQTYKPVEYGFAILGSMAVQGPVLSWVADHRKHHAHTDREGDPHSPHGHGGGVKGAVARPWDAPMGWRVGRARQARHARFPPGPFRELRLRGSHPTSRAWGAAGVLLPGAPG